MTRFIFIITIFSLLIGLQSDFYGQRFPQTTRSYGDHLIIGVLDNSKFELNPYHIRSPMQQEILQMIYGFGLTKKTGKVGNPPVLIERIVTQPSKEDARIWQMILKRNINFHDGNNLRNTDVKFTFDLLKKYGGIILNHHLDLKNIKSISVRGDLEIVFELYQPDEQFGIKLSDISILSQNYYRPLWANGLNHFLSKKPMGMGPFGFESGNQDSLTLSAHPHYYTGRPFLNKVKVKFYDDEQSLIDAFVNSQIDYMELPDRNTAFRLSDLLGSKAVFFQIPRPEKKLYTMLFNVNQFPLSEIEVRRAIYLALNRAEIVKRYMKEYGKVANTLVSQTNPYYDESLFSEEFDPQKAEEILRKGGWRLNKQRGILEKNGRPLSFELYFAQNSYLEENIARTIKLDLGELNIDVQPIPILPKAKKDVLKRSAYHSMIHTYYYDPQYLFEAFDQFYHQILGADQQRVNYRNNYLSQLFRLIYNNQTPRKNIFKRFQFFVHQEMPAIFLFFDEQIIIGLSNRFRDFRVTFKEGNRYIYRLNPIENWYVPKSLQKY